MWNPKLWIISALTGISLFGVVGCGQPSKPGETDASPVAFVGTWRGQSDFQDRPAILANSKKMSDSKNPSLTENEIIRIETTGEVKQCWISSTDPTVCEDARYLGMIQKTAERLYWIQLSFGTLMPEAGAPITTLEAKEQPYLRIEKGQLMTYWMRNSQKVPQTLYRLSTAEEEQIAAAEWKKLPLQLQENKKEIEKIRAQGAIPDTSAHTP